MADPNQAQKSLDIGTGTGLLALMLAQRFANLAVTAVDYDVSAFHCAYHNVTRSRFVDQIQVQHTDINTYHSPPLWPHIVCNPPYFTSGVSSKNKQRAVARHTDTLSHADLVHCLARLLTPTGCADLILPIKEAEALIEQAAEYGLYLRRHVLVTPSPNKSPSRLLFTLSPTTGTLRSDTITVRDEHGDYTQAFAALTRAFYLKLP
ncbi:tRNA1(Val) (adenine(37)-N6)-methyltransferase [Salinivibrio socompensis]|uniref:tRNA1(Val) (adenine(37)-N6)-methyltransferase n=1 Tax=Salinivibrio socompensis TaxID=1510206 RepID=UPI0004AF5C8B|nr:methyltransferase [Salinivibrio socompensis]